MAGTENEERRPLETDGAQNPERGVIDMIAQTAGGAPSVSRNQPSRVYRLRRDIPVWAPLVPVNRNASRALIEQYHDELPQEMAEQFAALVAREDGTLGGLARWADRFIDAYYNDLPLPMFGSSKFAAKGDFKAMGSREAALHAVLDRRDTGVTAAEARTHTGISGSAIGGGLSMLDQAGVLGRIVGEVRAPVPLFGGDA
jgi:hypothetical protein